MRRSRAPSNQPGAFFAAQFSAGYTINISGFDLRQAQGSVVKKFAVGMIGETAVLIASEAAAQDFVIEETTVSGIQQALQTNARTGRQIVQAYLDRIAAYDHKGPAFNSILTLNPKALAEADRLDAARATGAPGGPLDLWPVG